MPKASQKYEALPTEEVEPSQSRQSLRGLSCTRSEKCVTTALILVGLLLVLSLALNLILLDRWRASTDSCRRLPLYTPVQDLLEYEMVMFHRDIGKDREPP
ncbi:hypothetical protein WG66_011925 [Moniliophthora roreri]|uniref:Uncharacterized protein n=1 Tax=Moniliophthora roreri TaxID=221103 RepID=A0A0W0F3H2_MONRR|nr:hypothetical protein WG66_011925 [Moniliophthora roreri]